ncbi:hypothetical protein ACIGW4_31370 [Streptomyces sp. NPDC053513]|uniref:hypothetical protein n=1 Tax=unclassified Streptomyces TaxID=2593676 RepID=UPI0037D639CE
MDTKFSTVRRSPGRGSGATRCAVVSLRGRQASPARWWTERAPAAVCGFSHLLWASPALPGSTRDLTTTRTHGIVPPTP